MKVKEESIVVVQGRNGSIQLYRDRLVILRKGRPQLNRYERSKIEIYLADLKTVHYLSPTTSILGYIQFETCYNSSQLSNGLFMTAPIDNYSVIFSNQQEADFNELRTELCRLLEIDIPVESLKDVVHWC